MEFVKVINNRKFTLFSIILLFIYIILNLLDGERGLISYHQKQQLKNNLIQEKKLLSKKLYLVDKKNYILTEKIDLDFLETLYRKKFMVGKSNEKVYLNY